MHMSDALVAPAVAASLYAMSATAAGTSVAALRHDDDLKKIPTMAVMSSLVFAGQMVNYTIPGTGSSGHLCGGMLLSAILGPQAGFLSMIVILTIQCLFFADGGLLALGANIWNMGFYGCFLGYYLIYRPIMRGRLFSGAGSAAATRRKIVLSSILGCILSLQLGAFSVVLETSLSGITELPFAAFVTLMQPIHLAIGLVEGLITSAILLFVYQSRPELLRDVNADSKAASGHSVRSTLVILAVTTLFVGGGVSLLASSDPDGLEWSLFGNEEAGYSANMGLDEDDFGIESSVSEKAARVVENTAFLPDYALKSAPDAPAGTSLAGLVGSLIVAVIAAAVCLLGRFFRNNKKPGRPENNEQCA